MKPQHVADDVADAAAVLGQVVELGATPQQAELGAAVSQHLAERPVVRSRPDPEVAAALRSLATDPTPVLGDTGAEP